MNYFSSDFKLGILGGGQLGKMLLTETRKFDIQTLVLEPSEEAPARYSCNGFYKGSLMDFDTVYNFGKHVDVLTIEIENVNTRALADLEKAGKPLFDNRIGTTAKEVHYFITTKEDAKNVIGPQEYEDAWETTNRDKRVDNWIKKGLLRKVYKWIYTGENTEVINCDIKLDYLWRTVRPLWLDKDGKPASAQSTRPAAKAQKGGSAPAPVACIDARSVQPFNDGKTQLYVEDMPYKEGQDLDINPKKGWYPHMPQTSIVNTTVQEGSGQGALSPQSATEYSVFRQLGNGQATGVEDMFQITLEVVGDPYWLMQIPGKPGTAPWEEDVWEYEREQLTEDMMAEKRKKTASHNWLPFIYFQAQAPAADITKDDLMNLRPADAITGPKLNPNSPKIMAIAIIQTAAFKIEVSTEPVVRARSDWRLAKPGPGFRSAVASLLTARSIAR